GLSEAIREFVVSFHFHKLNDIDQEANRYILQALRDIKVCDPAIGSGAFPMGILQEIFRMVELCGEDDVFKDIWQMDEWDSARVKEEIIQNSIYGVDIEKGAVDIARLRFWLSIIIDEDEPKPLPNLDYKIVVGNSLLNKFEDHVIDIEWEIKEGTQTDTKTQDFLEIRSDLLKTISEKQKSYFGTESGNRLILGREIKDLKIDILVNQLEMKIAQDGIVNEPKLENFKRKAAFVKAQKLYLQTLGWKNVIADLKAIKGTNKPFNHFDWNLDFPAILNPIINQEGRGFDLVIGNPPYLRVQGIREIDTTYADLLVKLYSAATGSFDLYVLFVEVSLRLINSNGIVNFIMPVKWTNAAFGSGLRQVVTKNSAAFKIINFGAHQVFNASTYTGLQWFKANSDYLKYFELDRDILSTNDISKYLKGIQLEKASEISKDKLDEGSWILSSKEITEILNKLNRQPRRMSDIFEKIFQGLATSKDNVYFLYKCKEVGEYVIGFSKQLDCEVKIERNFVKPLLKGDDVHRYEPIKTDRFVLFPYKLIKNTAQLYEELELKNLFPLAYDYLKE
ncbi:MAG: Eco57I restriction-modification methylase domain-containing protein, partial [Cyclobacteriaceae bacterium]